MAKAIFRWLRGEINGYYLTNIYYSMNSYTSYIKDFFVKFKSMQFDKDSIDEDTLRGIGKFAGIFLPRIAKEDSLSSIRLTESAIVDETEVSESGLFKTSDETFDFSYAGTSSDINSNATTALRSSLVGDEAAQGYIAEDEEDVLDDDGLVRPNKVLTTPPEGKAYSDFYGNEFLFLSEGTTSYENLEKELYIELYKAMQWVRHNGVSVDSLRRITGIVCPNQLVTLGTITVINRRVVVSYTYNESADVTLKQQRLDLLIYIVKIKFPQVILEETT
jgi:hypothetical protein